MENQHREIKGYRELSEIEIAARVEEAQIGAAEAWNSTYQAALQRAERAELALARVTADFRTTQGALADAQDALARVTAERTEDADFVQLLHELTQAKAALKQLTAEREKVLEEAAKVCEAHRDSRYEYSPGAWSKCIKAIRALASKDGA
jgi:chromosome segregation ATPase